MRSPPAGSRSISLSLLLVAGVAASALAQPAAPPPPPDPPRRKPPTDAYPREAIAPFVEALLADKAGELDRALRRYTDLNKLSEQANTHYNIADLRRRMEKWKAAAESYRRYLALAPDAPDRAEVARLAAELEQRPGVAVIDGDDPDAIVFVNGRLVGPSPAIVQLPPGRHHAVRVTRTGYEHRSFDVRIAESTHVRATTSPRPGNVILSGVSRTTGSWRDNGLEYMLPGRMALPPGRHRTHFFAPGRTCTPLVFDAPREGELVYVHVEVTEVEGGGCQPMKVTQQKVRFAP